MLQALLGVGDLLKCHPARSVSGDAGSPNDVMCVSVGGAIAILKEEDRGSTPPAGGSSAMTFF